MNWTLTIVNNPELAKVPTGCYVTQYDMRPGILELAWGVCYCVSRDYINECMKRDNINPTTVSATTLARYITNFWYG